jgi:uncharacterized membrane protein/nitrite reductase/ring-hydroxylating ferredoxin subunit
MRSKASFRGHPIHPALIPFPFAFLIGALLFDGGARLLDRPTWSTTGGHLAAAGIVSALVAAVPGFIDYLFTVPPRSTGKRRATRHMLLNLTAVALITVAWLIRGESADGPAMLVLALELAGVVLLVIGGWMGGVLVSRNQVSVDHRYAGAGKWKDETVDSRPGKPVVVAVVNELKVDQMKLLRVGDKRIVLARSAKGYVAFDDRCTHRGGSLAGGTMICGTVQCPWHGSQFDVETGAVKGGPADQGIATYVVEQRGDEIVLVVNA